MPRLIVVSNRVAPPSRPGQASMGGLTAALGEALTDSGGIWFGWSGRTGPTAATPEVQAFDGLTIATLDLPEQDVAEYYNGYANTVLWPLFHHRSDLVRFERAFDEGYRRVNERFAEALCRLIRPGDQIWVHDYHLIPLGEALRRRGVTNPIGFFLHIPWPSHELLLTLPNHQALLGALFAYDLLGFQSETWRSAFTNSIASEATGAVSGDFVRAFGREVLTGVFPIGINAAGFASIASSPGAERSYTRAAATGVFRQMILGVDRVDYAKGLEERFLAFERLLQRHTELIEQTFLVQLGQPSRPGVRAFADIQTQLNAVSGRINGQWGSIDWSPIRFLNRSFDRDHIAGLYRASRVGLVTPLRDGMNLVAKEYVAAQDPGDPGVLILSKFAGAAAQMPDALIVNPYSLEDVAEALFQALHMSKAERVARWAKLMDGVVTEDATAWRDGFLRTLVHARGGEVGPIARSPVAVTTPKPRVSYCVARPSV